MIYFITFIIWCLYSSLFGISDAYYWYSANVAKYSTQGFKFKDLHSLFFWKRSLVATVFSLLMSKGNLFFWLLIMICLGLSFPFFHNGFYYQTRNKIDSTKYPLGFIDMSTTSIAIINFTFIIRLLMLILGIVGIIICYFNI